MTKLFIIGVLLIPAVNAKFMAQSEDLKRFAQTVQLEALNQELRNAIEEALGGGHGVDHERLQKMRDRMRDTFQSLYKNDYGRIELEGLRYLIHRYFAENHGWHIHGFAPHQKAEVGAKILTEKIPSYVEEILEARLDHQGFDLSDAVTMAALGF